MSLREADLRSIYNRHHANDAGFCRHYFMLYSIALGMETKSAFEFGCGFSSHTAQHAV